MNRGISVLETFDILSSFSAKEEERKLAKILGWLVEMLQAFFLVADDIMDQSITRRGQPCWYKRESVGNIAINDAFIIESCIYRLLRKHFSTHASYVKLMELFHEVTFQTELGQLIDLTTSNHDSDIMTFTMERLE